MKRTMATLLGLLGMLVVSNAGHAQGVYVAPRISNPYSRSPVSPYLNLFRGGSPAGVNYYNLVQPQIQTQNSIQRLQQNVTGLAIQQGATALSNPAIPSALGGAPLGASGGGGSSYFGNHLGFFLNVRTGPLGLTGGR